MTDVRLTMPAQSMTTLTLDTPLERERERLVVPTMKPIEEESE